MIEESRGSERHRWRDVGWRVLQLRDAFYHAGMSVPEAPGGHDGEGAMLVVPLAQDILDGGQLAGLFPSVQRDLGLLQTVILYALPVGDASPNIYRLEHLETYLQLKVPWLTVDPGEFGTTWQAHPAERAAALGQVFRNFREDHNFGVQEFAHLLGAGGGPSNPLPRLTPMEDDLGCLLVSDEEQSFFSLLYTLVEAAGDAGDVHGVIEWIVGAAPRQLRSILRQLHIDGEPADEAHVRRLERPPDHYWSRAAFADAMAALGLMAVDGTTSPRFARLEAWLDTTRGLACLSMVTIQVDGAVRSLADLVATRGRASSTSDGDTRLKQLAVALARLTAAREFTTRGGDMTDANSDALREFGMVRFNLPGEYLLRRDETISRTFFATALSTVNLRDSSSPHATAFALGTLLDFDAADPESVERIIVLRQLLEALAQLGLGHRWNESAARLEVARQEEQRLKWHKHEVRTALGLLRMAIDEVAAAEPPADLVATLRRRYGIVYSLCEFMIDRTTPDTQWPPKVSDMLAVLRDYFADGSSKTFALNCDPSCTSTLPDAVSRRVLIMLMSLVDNAHKCAGRHGHVQLSCECDTVSGDIVISVENTGVVMDTSFAEYLRGASNAVPERESRECVGLQTIRTVLRDLQAQSPTVHAPAPGAAEGTRITVRLPARLATGGPR